MDDRTEAIIEELRAEIKRLKERIRLLERENRQLREEPKKTQRQMVRQTAPFRREERKKIPPDKNKPAGRKPGHRALVVRNRPT
jgi:regulator of replication initiation timing